MLINMYSKRVVMQTNDNDKADWFCKDGSHISRPTLSTLTYLEGLVEEETEVGEDDPQLLPSIAVLELTQQVATQLVL